MNPHPSRLSWALLLALPLLGAVGGYGAGPFLARRSATVQLAAQIHLEEVAHAKPTVESDAFRATARPTVELYAEAAGIVRRFRMGGAIFGFWCGLVVSLKLLSATRDRRQTTYDIDGALCVSCGRCFMACPQEHARRGLVGAVPPARRPDATQS